MDDIIDRVRMRLRELNVSDDLLSEYISTVSDRLCLRLGKDTLPTPFESVCVDAVIKMYRRTYYEGISTEGVESISTSFVDDILNEYAPEIAMWKERQANEGAGSGKVVRFL